jgi:hypothetical protein
MTESWGKAETYFIFETENRNVYECEISHHLNEISSNLQSKQKPIAFEMKLTLFWKELEKC